MFPTLFYYLDLWIAVLNKENEWQVKYFLYAIHDYPWVTAFSSFKYRKIATQMMEYGKARY